MAKIKKNFRDRMVTALSTIKSPTFRVGFANIDLWVDSGNLAMNRRWSGRFDRAYLFGRQYIFYGESGSGKSLMCALAAANAQKQHDALVVWLDIEKATDDEAGRAWLKRAGVNEDNLVYLSMATLAEVKQTITTMVVDIREMVANGETVQPIVFVVDSWAAAITETEWERTGGKKAGELVGDQGQKAKQTGQVILAITHLVAGLPIMVLGVQHIMDNQDGYGRRHKTTGGNKMIFYASGCMLLTKSELKEEDASNPEILEHYKKLDSNMSAAARDAMGKNRFIGITSTMEILKSRVSKPFERVELQIPWLTGMDRYSGLFEVLQQEGIVTTPSKGWYQYMDGDKEVKFQRGSFRNHADRIVALNAGDISSAETEPPQEVADDNPDEA